MKSYFKRIFSVINPEALIWILGLLILAFINIDNASHFTICPLKNMGIDFCPGCGLGKSIHYLMNFEIVESIKAHPLGIFALAVLFNRIYKLITNSFMNVKTYLLTKRENIYAQSSTINAKY